MPLAGKPSDRTRKLTLCLIELTQPVECSREAVDGTDIVAPKSKSLERRQCSPVGIGRFLVISKGDPGKTLCYPSSGNEVRGGSIQVS